MMLKVRVSNRSANLKKWKDLRRDLQQKPGDDCVGDRNLVNIASLQLCEEVLLYACLRSLIEYALAVATLPS